MPEEIYSNPLAPPDHHHQGDDDDGFRQPFSSANEKQNLTNADFRKLLMTPRSVHSGGSGSSKSNQTPSTHSFSHHRNATVDIGSGSKGSDSKSKKKPHFKVKKEEEDELNEIMKKYRDRAKERREGEIQEIQQEVDLIQASGYRAVAPDVKANMDAAEKRKKMIEESKYLGGDMEHTHLVKGLDYSLLQKVRSEIVSKEKEEDDLEEAYLARKSERDEIESQLKSVLAKNIYATIFKSEPATVNEIFAPRRMAYIVELDDEYADTDIPTTLIRSKADCPVDEASTNLSINDIVIQKLTQVLSYLRTDSKKKRKGKDKLTEEERSKAAQQGIFDDAGDYVPNLVKKTTKNETREKNYFEKPSSQTEEEKTNRKEVERRGKDRRGGEKSTKKEKDEDRFADGWAPADISLQKQIANKPSKTVGKGDANVDGGTTSTAAAPAKVSTKYLCLQGGKVSADSYAECYPGGYECYDAAGDSDDEADFSKMDLGNRKGPIRRWDFETEEDYERYMSKREALPKAAFQYGVKMGDGRKTRKLPGPKNELHDKAKLDRQWAKISQIISKRKDDKDAGGESSAKRPKY